MKTKFTKILCIMLGLLYAQKSVAQDTVAHKAAIQTQDTIAKYKIVLMVRQPLTWFTKPSFYVGLKSNASTVFLSASYYNNFSGKGPQLALEYQRNFEERAKYELFFYGRLAIGQFDEQGASSINYNNYASVGGGVGWNIFLGKKMKYFFQPTVGANIPILDANSGFYDQLYFYVGGPGSYLDIKLRFGQRIFDR